jgi:hypothetical protein
MKKKIINPVWANIEKTHVMCMFEYEDGTSVTASVMNTPDGENNNPDWDAVFEEHTEKSITEFSDKQERNIYQAAAQPIVNEQPRDTQRDMNEMLFQAKLDAFEIEEVKNSKNRTLKSKVRKAKTLLEVTAFTAAIIVGSVSAPTTKKKK